MPYPVRSMQPISALVGQTNGRLPDSILVSTMGQAGGATVRLVSPAARAWRALCAAALAAGHVLKATSAADSYRLYSIQERIFRERYTTSYLAGRPYKVWNGVRWYQRPGTAVAAVPGTSNHGWARAVDTGEERDSDAGAESLDDPTLDWLLANEERFGWSHEVQSEPWHLRYFGGDIPPQAVLDYESGTSEEDDEMADQLVWYKFTKADGTEATACYRVLGNLGKWLNPDGYRLCKQIGVKEVNTGALDSAFDATWQNTLVLVDGPCRNTPNDYRNVAVRELSDADLAAIAKAVNDEEHRRSAG